MWDSRCLECVKEDVLDRVVALGKIVVAAAQQAVTKIVNCRFTVGACDDAVANGQT